MKLRESKVALHMTLRQYRIRGKLAKLSIGWMLKADVKSVTTTIKILQL